LVPSEFHGAGVVLEVKIQRSWVQTVPGKFWFPYFRLYAPTEPCFAKSWPLPDIEKVK